MAHRNNLLLVALLLPLSSLASPSLSSVYSAIVKDREVGEQTFTNVDEQTFIARYEKYAPALLEAHPGDDGKSRAWLKIRLPITTTLLLAPTGSQVPLDD